MDKFTNCSTLEKLVEQNDRAFVTETLIYRMT